MVAIKITLFAVIEFLHKIRHAKMSNHREFNFVTLNFASLHSNKQLFAGQVFAPHCICLLL